MRETIIEESPFSGPYWTPDLVAELKANDQNGQVGTQLVSQEQGVLVWHLKLPPGGRAPFHRHSKDYFWTILTSGLALSRFGNGSVKRIEYSAGDTRHFAFAEGESFIHDLENTGDTDLVFVTVEKIVR
jgi:uncharacterized cupin superfamily protein